MRNDLKRGTFYNRSCTGKVYGKRKALNKGQKPFQTEQLLFWRKVTSKSSK